MLNQKIALFVILVLLIAGCTSTEKPEIPQNLEINNSANTQKTSELSTYNETDVSSELEQTEIQPESNLQIVTKQPSSVQSEVISVQVNGSSERISVSDGVATVLTRSRNIEVIDVSDPKLPKHLKTLGNSGFAELVYHDGNYLFVADKEGLQVYKDDLGEPVGKFSLENNFWPEALTVNSNLVYLISGDQMMILDAQDPKSIKKLSTTPLNGLGPNKVIVKDGYAYVIETLGGLNIIDIKDPIKPNLVKIIPFESQTVGFEIKEKYAYLARVSDTISKEDSYSSKSIFEVYDITNPSSAYIVASSEVETTFIDLDIDGDYVYIAGTFPHRLSIFDISSPAKPVKIPKNEVITGSANFQDIVVSNDYAYFADGLAGLIIADISDLDNPDHYTGELDLSGRGSRIFKQDNLLYVTVEKKHADFFDVKNPLQPKLTYSELYKSSYQASNFDSSGKLVFINSQGLKIYDTSNPKKPFQVQKSMVGADAIQVEGNYLFSTIGEIGLLVYDITDNSPELVSTIPLSGQARDLNVDGNWAVATTNIPYSVILIDLSNPKKPVEKQVYLYSDYPGTANIKDGFVYVPRGYEGVDILKVEPDGSLVLISNIPGEDYAHPAVASGNKLFILRRGVEIYDISDPKKPSFITRINTGESTMAVIDENYLYIADGIKGMTVIDISEYLSGG